MNIDKINSKLTEQIIDIINAFNAYEGITESNSLWTYHRENGAEILDIDFRLAITDNGLMVIANKSYDKTAISGGCYTQDTQAEIEPMALEVWLEDNNIFTKKAHCLANEIYNAVENVYNWSIKENEIYNVIYSIYNKSSCELVNAIQILLERLTDLTDRYYIQKIFAEIQLNEEKMNNLF